MSHELRKDGGLFVVTAQVSYKNSSDVYQIPLVFDTGAAVTIIDTGIVHQLGYSARADGIMPSSLGGAGGDSLGYLIKVPHFQCLDFTFNNFSVACHDMETRLGVAGLLGMNFLRHFQCEIDFSTGLILRMQPVTAVPMLQKSSSAL